MFASFADDFFLPFEVQNFPCLKDFVCNYHVQMIGMLQCFSFLFRKLLECIWYSHGDSHNKPL